MTFQCDRCLQTFGAKQTLKRHLAKKYKCQQVTKQPAKQEKIIIKIKELTIEELQKHNIFVEFFNEQPIKQITKQPAESKPEPEPEIITKIKLEENRENMLNLLKDKYHEELRLIRKKYPDRGDLTVNPVRKEKTIELQAVYSKAMKKIKTCETLPDALPVLVDHSVKDENFLKGVSNEQMETVKKYAEKLSVKNSQNTRKAIRIATRQNAETGETAGLLKENKENNKIILKAKKGLETHGVKVMLDKSKIITDKPGDDDDETETFQVKLYKPMTSLSQHNIDYIKDFFYFSPVPDEDKNLPLIEKVIKYLPPDNGKNIYILNSLKN